MQQTLIQETSIPGSKFLGTYEPDELDYLKPGHRPLTCISLFTGVGGFDLGFAAAGFETRVMVEWDKDACATLRANFTIEGHRVAAQHRIDQWQNDNPDKQVPKSFLKWLGQRPAGLRGAQKHEPVIMQVDITKTSTEAILDAAKLRVGEASALTGGFPCQGFSTANGTRDNSDHTKDKRNLLYLECVRVIKEALPKAFVLENVQGLISMESGRVIRMIAKDLAECGYTVNWNVINCADYGVPQNRIRVIIMGTRNDGLKFDTSGKGNPQYHIGGAAGPVYHPEWYAKKYKITLEPWEKTHDQPKGKQA